MSQLYSPLDPTRSQIRLLKFEPASTSTSSEHDQAVSKSPRKSQSLFLPRCAMDVVSLDDGPAFVALSYVWGDPTETTPMTVNGVEVTITRNLHHALSMMSSDMKTVYFWVDAVCIHQADDDEKSSQLSIMSRIYREAISVRCQLGSLTSNLEAYLQYRRQVEHGSDVPWTQLRLAWDRQGLSSEKQLMLTAAIFAGQAELNDLPYFERMWTLQESILPGRRAEFYIDDRRVEDYDPRRHYEIPTPHFAHEAWEQVVKTSPAELTPTQQQTMILLGDMSSPRALLSQFHHVTQTLMLVRDERPGNILANNEESSSFMMSSLLTATCRRLCSEPRDKIFVVLAVLQPIVAAPSKEKEELAAMTQVAREVLLNIDYRKPVERVVRDALLYVFNFEAPPSLGLICKAYMPYRDALSRRRRRAKHTNSCGSQEGEESQDISQDDEEVPYASWLPDMTTRKHTTMYAPGIPATVKPPQDIEWLSDDFESGRGDRIRLAVKPLGRVTHHLLFPSTAEGVADVAAAILSAAWPRSELPLLGEFHQAASSKFGIPVVSQRLGSSEELLQINELVSLMTQSCAAADDFALREITSAETLFTRLSRLLLTVENENVQIDQHEVPLWLLLPYALRSPLPDPADHSYHSRRYQHMTASIEERLANCALIVLDSGLIGLCSNTVEAGDVAVHSPDLIDVLLLRPDCQRLHCPSEYPCDGSPGDHHPGVDDEEDLARQTHIFVDYASISGLHDDEKSAHRVVEQIERKDAQIIVLG
ncbi:heterokaryon incompatibility protein-domain-containing protein [Microdochium trichocladiopsis]|uniref:Heterokaryon incompatibility protein-domain-containing protein n=1 Tax=Microdochium trichocladiopsis TaxID=1682393 RepID=A0A9P8XZD6_9PEZI|nr:heterokaryon incompatibility protein-domain-containing protein [Microdochium trichocladiopsis]KAH7024855.1 heterokaryon incompatibility protein-domain-containing protein [Microdochium trichocladiopsis]